MTTFSDLERLLKKCPDIVLTAEDIQEIIDTESFNNCISRHKNGGVLPEPVEEVVVEVVEEDDEDLFDDEDLDEVEEVKTHIDECTDEFCECKSCFDEIEEEI